VQGAGGVAAGDAGGEVGGDEGVLAGIDAGGGDEAEGIEVHGDDARDALHGGHELAGGDALAEGAGREGERGGEGEAEGGEHVVAEMIRVGGDAGGEAEAERDVRREMDGARGVAGGVERGAEILEGGGAGIDGAAVGGGDGEVDELALAVPEGVGAGLADAGEGAGVVLVVAEGDDAVEREDGERGVIARVGEFFRVGGAGGGQRVDDGLGAEGAAEEGGERASGDLALQAEAGAVGGDDVVDAGGQARAGAAVAEADGGGAVVRAAQGVNAL
jgi:hypothetical protein